MDGETWTSESTIHLEFKDLGDESSNCFVCFAERYGKASAVLGGMNDGDWLFDAYLGASSASLLSS